MNSWEAELSISVCQSGCVRVQAISRRPVFWYRTPLQLKATFTTQISPCLWSQLGKIRIICGTTEAESVFALHSRRYNNRQRIAIQFARQTYTTVTKLTVFEKEVE